MRRFVQRGRVILDLSSMQVGTYWFRRFVKECKKMSPYLKIVPVKMGFYRIYWVGGGVPAYVHEVYKNMPFKGYDIEERDPRFMSKKYYQEFEDQAELTLKIKNYVEGYTDSIKTLQKRVYQLKNSREHLQTSRDAYKHVVVK
jgi:hypothetical protein